tara:strand:- start:2508 stop:3053 length:546 start_codon:yes stop_codon:yes gene_type:complete
MTGRQIIFLALVLPVIAVAGFWLHEFGHWAMGEALGHEMVMSLNGAHPVDRFAPLPPGHANLILAAGPAVTVALAALAVFIVRASAVLGFAIAFFALHMRIMAYGISVLANPNDEAKIGLNLGLGPHMLHLAVIAVTLLLALFIARKAQAGWLAWLVAFVASSASLALVVMLLDPLIGRIL